MAAPSVCYAPAHLDDAHDGTAADARSCCPDCCRACCQRIADGRLLPAPCDSLWRGWPVNSGTRGHCRSVPRLDEQVEIGCGVIRPHRLTGREDDDVPLSVERGGDAGRPPFLCAAAQPGERACLPVEEVDVRQEVLIRGVFPTGLPARKVGGQRLEHDEPPVTGNPGLRAARVRPVRDDRGPCGDAVVNGDIGLPGSRSRTFIARHTEDDEATVVAEVRMVRPPLSPACNAAARNTGRCPGGKIPHEHRRRPRGLRQRQPVGLLQACRRDEHHDSAIAADAWRKALAVRGLTLVAVDAHASQLAPVEARQDRCLVRRRWHLCRGAGSSRWRRTRLLARRC